MSRTGKLFKVLRIAGLLSLFLTLGAVQSWASFWELQGSVGTHDPTIIKENSLWWQMNTGTGIAVKYSSDGKYWNNGTRIFANPLSWWKTYAPNMSRNDVWAPDLHYFNGRVWCYYSVSEFGKKQLRHRVDLMFQDYHRRLAR